MRQILFIAVTVFLAMLLANDEVPPLRPSGLASVTATQVAR